MISFISGCFDGPYLHLGHRYILAHMEGYRVIALNSDDYIRRKKREPLCNELERKSRLYSLGIDEVVLYNDDSPINIINSIQPDLIYVGDDYTKDQVAGFPECIEWGGDVVIIPRIGKYSTTNLFT